MPYPQQELIDTVKALPAKRQQEVRQFIGLLNQSEEIIKMAMEWIVEHLPDRYCADEPRFDVVTFNWYVPILLTYPTGKGAEVGRLIIDARTHELIDHTVIKEIRANGRRFAETLDHAR